VRLEEVAIAGSNEVLQAVQILAGRDVQAIWVPGDNTAEEGYEQVVKVARDARLPLISDDCDSLPRGGLACVGVSFQSAGMASGKLAGKILLGANPANIPLEEVAVEQVSISRGEAAKLGIAIPSEYSSKLSP
jgi:putative tryptophan/tyrosine transport system substrate-binding protein